MIHSKILTIMYARVVTEWQRALQKCAVALLDNIFLWNLNDHRGRVSQRYEFRVDRTRHREESWMSWCSVTTNYRERM